MKQLTLRDVQNISLDILQHVHEFCVNHNIEYSLAYGTLIGAIRHKGFIPWDDDIDIVMTRPNFDKFCREYIDNSNFELVAPYQGDSYLAFARVCDVKRTVVDDYLYPWSKKKHGIWIDIFPLDATDDDEKKANKVIDSFEKAWAKARLIRISHVPLGARKGIFFNIKLFIRKFIYCFSSPSYSQKVLFLEHSYEKSNFIGNLTFLRYKYKERYKKEWFSSFEDVNFEGHQFKSVAEYDDYLRCIYGDYMILPPEDKRKPLHSFHKNYWKSNEK